MVNEHSMGEEMQHIYKDQKSLYNKNCSNQKKGKEESCQYDLWQAALI